MTRRAPDFGSVPWQVPRHWNEAALPLAIAWGMGHVQVRLAMADRLIRLPTRHRSNQSQLGCCVGKAMSLQRPSQTL